MFRRKHCRAANSLSISRHASLQVRKDYVGTADYPTTKLIENVGVRPEIVDDYMTKANLMQNGVHP